MPIDIVRDFRASAWGCAAVLGLLALTSPASADPSYVIVMVPGAFGTSLVDINSSGYALGGFTDSETGGPVHGFLRAPDGTITTFDPPGSTNTFVSRINDNGTVAGTYSDAAGDHGFIRTLDGMFTSFDVPGSVNAGAQAINGDGATAGSYGDSAGIYHGFVRAPDGTFTTFDTPNAYDTSACCINKNGVVAGVDEPASGPTLAYVRTTDGKITTFAATHSADTSVYDLNADGTTVGRYIVKSGHAYAFERTKDGTVTTFDLPGTAVAQANGINGKGDIVGWYAAKARKPLHHQLIVPFIRDASGQIEMFQLPGFRNIDTYATAVNNSGVVVGYYYHVRGNSPSGAFVRTP